jgi:MFS family permease
MATPKRDAVRMAFYFFLVTGCFGFLQPFLPLYMQAAGLDKLQIGIVTGLGAGLALLVQPLLGKLTDKLDARKGIILGSALVAWVAYSAFPYADSFPIFLLLTALGANGVMHLNSSGGVLIARLAQSGAGGAHYANIRLWGSVGYIVTSLASGWIVLQGGAVGLERQSLDRVLQGGALLFLAVACLALFLPDRRHVEEAIEGETGKAPLPLNLKWFLGAYFLYTIALYGATGFLSLFLKDLGAQGLVITGTFAAGVLVEVFVMRWAGRFSDQFGRRPTLALTFLLLPFRLLLYMPATGALWILGVQSLHGLNFGIMGAVAIVFANDLATDRTRGHAQSRLFAAAGLANCLGPFLFGWVAETFGLRGMFGVAAIVAAAAALVFLFKVEESHPGSESLADRAPVWMKPMVRWLDAPGGRTNVENRNDK